MIFFIAIIIIPTIIMCRVCAQGCLHAYFLPGIVTFLWAGIEIGPAYYRAFSPTATYQYQGNQFVKALKFVGVVCVHIAAIISFLVFVQLRFNTLWYIATTYYCCIVLVQVLRFFTAPHDSDIKENINKIGWLDVIHKDILTSDATEEDWHRPRGDEDWHGL